MWGSKASYRYHLGKWLDELEKVHEQRQRPHWEMCLRFVENVGAASYMLAYPYALAVRST